MSINTAIERLIFAEAFSLWSLSIIIVIMSLYSLMSKKAFDRISLAFIALAITSGTYLFSQTSFFANIFNFIEPERVLYPVSIYRVVSLGLLSLAAAFWVAFLTGYQKRLWLWIVGIVTIGSIGAFVFEPLLVR